jgi:hypothetical protein
MLRISPRQQEALDAEIRLRFMANLRDAALVGFPQVAAQLVQTYTPSDRDAPVEADADRLAIFVQDCLEAARNIDVLEDGCQIAFLAVMLAAESAEIDGTAEPDPTGTDGQSRERGELLDTALLHLGRETGSDKARFALFNDWIERRRGGSDYVENFAVRTAAMQAAMQ